MSLTRLELGAESAARGRRLELSLPLALPVTLAVSTSTSTSPSHRRRRRRWPQCQPQAECPTRSHGGRVMPPTTSARFPGPVVSLSPGLPDSDPRAGPRAGLGQPTSKALRAGPGRSAPPPSLQLQVQLEPELECGGGARYFRVAICKLEDLNLKPASESDSGSTTVAALALPVQHWHWQLRRHSLTRTHGPPGRPAPPSLQLHWQLEVQLQSSS